MWYGHLGRVEAPYLWSGTFHQFSARYQNSYCDIPESEVLIASRIQPLRFNLLQCKPQSPEKASVPKIQSEHSLLADYQESSMPSRGDRCGWTACDIGYWPRFLKPTRFPTQPIYGRWRWAAALSSFREMEIWWRFSGNIDSAQILQVVSSPKYPQVVIFREVMRLAMAGVIESCWAIYNRLFIVHFPVIIILLDSTKWVYHLNLNGYLSWEWKDNIFPAGIVDFCAYNTFEQNHSIFSLLKNCSWLFIKAR